MCGSLLLSVAQEEKICCILDVIYRFHKDFAHGWRSFIYRADTFQFFSRNPRGSGVRKLDVDDIQALNQLMADHHFAPILAHAPYTLNGCSKTAKTRDFARQAMADDLRRLEYVDNCRYNFHPGSHVGQGAETGIALIADLLNTCMFPGQKTTVLLETMAGKGTEVGRTFEELAAIIDKVAMNDKLGVCLDTCHVFDGGYDIVHHLDDVLTTFDKVIGLKRLKAVHINDSKNELASHKDRHEKIGDGHIGLEAFRRIVNHPAAGPALLLGNAERPRRVCPRNRLVAVFAAVIVRRRDSMRILHTADWHLGKLFYGNYLTEDQAYVLEQQFLPLLRDEGIDAVVLAGDVYDRSLPPAEAVELFDDIATKITADLKIPFLVISGNHDSPARLSFASRLLAPQGLYIAGELDRLTGPVVLEDEAGPVAFLTIPYAEPAVVRQSLARKRSAATSRLWKPCWPGRSSPFPKERVQSASPMPLSPAA